MPIYEYLCQSCQKLSEVMQKFSDAPLTDCEHCGEKGTLAKQMSLSSFALKGSGWYATDYKKKSVASGSSPSGESGNGTTASNGQSSRSGSSWSNGTAGASAVAGAGSSSGGGSSGGSTTSKSAESKKTD